MTVEARAIGGSFDARPGAVESTAGGHHWHEARSIRFIPEPSPGSSGAWGPIKRDARKELTRWIRSVEAYVAGSRFENLRICAAVNRSNAREPVRSASTRLPPTARSISAHSLDVLESIQIGATSRERSGLTCSARGRPGSKLASAFVARSLRYTLPCCCADPEIATSWRRSRSLCCSR